MITLRGLVETSAKLYQLSLSEFQYDTGIFRFVSMRGVEIYVTSPGKLII